MTTSTPPGWYAEPGHAGTDQAVERWWDGNAWTEYTRTPQQPGAVPAAPGYPAYPADLVAGGGDGGRRGGVIAVGIIAALVLVAGVVGGIYALNSGDDTKTTAGSSPSTSPSAPSGGGPGAPDGGDGGPGGGTQAPRTTPNADPGFAADTVDGISLPVPDGWEGRTDQYGLAWVTTGEYECPADTSQSCLRGGVSSMPAEALSIKATTAEAAAKEDIEKNATDSYGEEAYGAITSHKQLASEKVTVAGKEGYLVRWQVVTEKGDDGYVQSLVFPAPGGSGRLVVVRFGFDISDKAPELSVMDTITKGIKASATSGSGIEV